MNTDGTPESAVRELTRQEQLLPFLLNPNSYPHRPRRVRLVQTHSSFVFLAPPFVYKVKKPVNFGFLNFSTLKKRRYFCEREVELNRRLCPKMYLGVVEAQASDATVKQRLRAREAKPDEVSDARLEDFEMLTRLYEPPVELPKNCRLTISTTTSVEATLIATLTALAEAQVRTYDSKSADKKIP